MTNYNDNRVLQVTRWIIYFIMALMAFFAVALALVAAVLPFYWAQVAAEFLKQYPSLDTQTLFPIIYMVFALGIVVLALVWEILRKLLAIMNSVADGDPFIRANAVRLKVVGWLMVAAQITGLLLAVAAREGADLFGEHNVDFDVSLSGILSIMLVFILAGIFERGAEMREELEGTV